MSNSRASIPIQRKVSLTLVLLIAAFVAVSYTVLRAVIAPAFDDLEFIAARSDLHRAEAAIDADLQNLRAVTADWAPWDDIYSFVNGENPGFLRSNLNRPTLTNLGLDLLAVYASGNQLVWAQLQIDGEEVTTDSLNILRPERAESNGLTGHRDALDRTFGFVQTVHGPMIISSSPILRSDDSGPVAGAVIMAQFLDAARMQRLQERTGVNLAWESVYSSAPVDPSFNRMTADIVGSTQLIDIHGKPVLELMTATPRSISTLGARTINVATLFLIGAGILICGFIWFMLRFTILRPIEQLSRHIDEIRDSGDLSRQLSMQRGDEVGGLARQFDSMTAELFEARGALLDQSFKAGKADTAAEVMHNIRNALTPLINGIDRLRKSFGVTANLRIAEATAQISDPDCPKERKDKFIQYVSASFEHIKTVGDEALEDLNVVSAQAKQVEGILAEQQRFANVAPIAESLNMDELLDEASNVIPKEDTQSVELSVDNEFARIRVFAHRIGLLQVMGNLILNSYESIKRSGAGNGQITLQGSTEIIDESPMVRVTIKDNGKGFNRDAARKIFQRGFTSKVRGETNGLGLHWCANAVASMGGQISAQSEGEGRGAEFHVLLPAAQGG